MMHIFGLKVELAENEQCTMSADNHRKLMHEARVDRQTKGYNVEDSFVVCMRCRKAISLKI